MDELRYYTEINISLRRNSNKLSYPSVYWVIFAESDGLSNGMIAGVVISVLFVLLAIIGMGLYWRRQKKKEDYKHERFNNPIMYRADEDDADDLD